MMLLSATDFLERHRQVVFGDRICVSAAGPIQHARDCLLFPNIYAEEVPQWWLRREQGVFDSDLNHIESQSDRRQDRLIWWPGAAIAKRLKQDASPRTEEAAIYGGTIYDHFGHFLLDSLSRVYNIVSSARFDGMDILFHEYRPHGRPSLLLSQKYIDILEHIGLDAGRVRTIEQPVKIRNLVLSDSMFFDGLFAARNFFRTARSAGGATGRGGAFISRSHLKAGTSEVRNSLEVDACARDHGLAVFHPETMSFREQMQILSDHDYVCGMPSSFFHLKILSRFSTPLYFLIPSVEEALHINFLNLDVALAFGDRFFLVDSEKVAPSPGFVRAFTCSLDSLRQGFSAIRQAQP
ncbi:glycosyltransferase 61 family protein [Roseomonas sp. USHLN139]|uniref:glycosyltransferase 61 family protein n=1 Tax=Roseomonas sp. USHLN139 TaxID=3081298 RepID=UPI003B0143FC